MQRIAGSLLAVSLGACTLLGCDSLTAPTRPTAPSSGQMAPAAISVVGRSTAAVIPWPCITSATSAWQAADCDAAGSRAQHIGISAGALVAPASPTNLTGSASGSRVTFQWIGPVSGDPPSSYVVEAGSATGRADLANFDTDTTLTVFTADSVPAGTYFVRVRAKNSAGLSPPSNEVSVTVGGGAPPPCAGAPSSPSGLIATVTGTSLTLTWTAPATGCPPTSYTVEAGSGPALADLATVNTGSTATSFTASGVGAGTYFARVRAVNDAGRSTPSNEVIFAVTCVGPPGPPPGQLGWTTRLKSTMQIFWNAAAGFVTSYVVEVGSFPGGRNLAVVDTGSTALSYTFTGVLPGTYYVRVRGKNPCGTSGPSNEAFPRVFE